MSLDIGADAGIELGPVSLEALAGLHAGINSLSEFFKNARKIEEAYQFGAVQVKLANVATSDAASDALEIGLGGPAYGRRWQIRSLAIGGALWTTSVTGTAVVMIGSVKNNAPPLTDIVDNFSSLPGVHGYSTGQIIVRHPNQLRVVILTPAATTQFVAGGYAEDLPDRREQIEITS